MPGVFFCLKIACIYDENLLTGQHNLFTSIPQKHRMIPVKLQHTMQMRNKICTASSFFYLYFLLWSVFMMCNPSADSWCWSHLLTVHVCGNIEHGTVPLGGQANWTGVLGVILPMQHRSLWDVSCSWVDLFICTALVTGVTGKTYTERWNV